MPCSTFDAAQDVGRITLEARAATAAYLGKKGLQLAPQRLASGRGRLVLVQHASTGGFEAARQGADSVRGGAEHALAAIADCRLGAPEGKAEQQNGDGAVAFVLGSEGVIAEIEATASLTREFLDYRVSP